MTSKGPIWPSVAVSSVKNTTVACSGLEAVEAWRTAQTGSLTAMGVARPLAADDMERRVVPEEVGEEDTEQQGAHEELDANRRGAQRRLCQHVQLVWLHAELFVQD